MYTYFAFPRKLRSFRILMTGSQIFQFLHVLFYCFLHLANDRCDEERYVLFYETFWYLVYLVLFCNFFVQQYLAKGKKLAAKKE